MGRRKVTIVGAGRVGATATQMLAKKDICDVVLLNRTASTAAGIALDIAESSVVEGFDSKVIGTGDYAAMDGSDVVAITAGEQRKEGMSRDDLLKVNANIVASVCEQVKAHAPNSKLIILTNPLDAMVYLAKKKSGFQRERVIGMAGILDSSRFGTFTAEQLGVGYSNVSALVLGGHGDFMVPMPRHTTVSGVPITNLLDAQRIKSIADRTRDAGAEIIKLEGSSAFYAPAASLVKMIDAIINDRKSLLPCSAVLSGEYGISGVMGVPVVLGSGGIERIVEIQLSDEERAAIRTSAGKIAESVMLIDKMGF
ncbi:MAG: malate dehydrogenase [Candidatus Micrarchaeota archaeon]|nr:malate dehydrogenase [Candidatus Micrarchaeota archaeon]MDE1804268.1 malate dehydrogenase [Candidatus Micrarchaeota archaeon]